MSQDIPTAGKQDRVFRLQEQHARLAERIETFDARLWLNERERLERKRLQKLKLAIKDQLAELGAMGEQR